MKTLLTFAIFLALPLCAQVRFTRMTDRISVEIDGKPYTEFFLSADGNKPYLYPLRTASGLVVTRHYPMQEFAGETSDHPHHRGMFFSQGDINGYNFWATEPLRPGAVPARAAARRGSMALKQVVELRDGAKSGTVQAIFAGLDPQRKPIMLETRTITFYSEPTLRTIDFDIAIEALERLKFGDTKEGTFGIRLATSMTEDAKLGGRMVNAEGRETEKEVWGKRSAWLDYSGPVEGRTVGVLVMDHPGNPRHPTYWHARAYGLLAANIFGLHDFLNDKTQDGSMVVEPGQTVRFRYRVVIHPGGLHAIDAPALFKQFAAAPPPLSSARAGAQGLHADPEWVRTKYGAWAGPGVDNAPGPMDTILLKDWAPRSSVVVPENPVPKARYPVIDVHAHVEAKTPEQVSAWVKTMDETGIGKTVILTGATGAGFDRLADLYLKPYPNRFQLYCGVETDGMEKPGYPERAAAELERCYRKGARGIGELSDKGWGYGPSQNVPRDRRLHPDDPRLDLFWEKAAELKMPANIHVADHPSCWAPLDLYQERTPDYQHFNLYGKDVPSYDELIAIRNRVLARHPKTVFIACHLGNQGNDLAALSRELDRYPNLYLDISARDYEIGRTPRAAVKFLTRYRNRVMFGTDMGREKTMYQAWWRLLETADEYMPGRVWWRYYGLELPAPALEALYRGNAQRVLNWK